MIVVGYEWQSQAAKLQNQLNEVKEYATMVDYLEPTQRPCKV